MKSNSSTIITSSSPLLPPPPQSSDSYSPIVKYNEVIELYNEKMKSQKNKPKKRNNNNNEYSNDDFPSETHESSNCNLSIINDENLFLTKISESQFYEKMIFPLMTKKWKMLFLSLFLLLVPIVNFIFLGFFIYVYCLFIKCRKVWAENEEKVGDIFKEMIFAPELCAKMRKNHYTFEIEIEGNNIYIGIQK